MKKLLRGLLLSLMLCFALLPNMANAETTTTYYLWQVPPLGTIYYATTDTVVLTSTIDGTELTSFNFSDANYVLLTDIRTSDTITITGSVSLDLNDHVWENTGADSVIKVGTSTSPGALTVKDKNPSGSSGAGDSGSSSSSGGFGGSGDSGSSGGSGSSSGLTLRSFTEDPETGLWYYSTPSSGEVSPLALTTPPTSTTSPTSTTHQVLGGIITGGNAVAGGGVYIETGSTFTMEGGNIIGCSAGPATSGGSSSTPSGGASSTSSGGGGVYANGATFTMNRGSIKGCTSTTNGGGVLINGGTFNLYGGEIDNCKATADGGGVYFNGSTFEMKDNSTVTPPITPTIQNCTAANGGGIYFSNGLFTISTGTISSCTASQNGGGVYVVAGKKLTVGGADNTPVTLNIFNNTCGTSPNITANNVYLAKSTSGGSSPVEAEIETNENGLSHKSKVYVTKWDDSNIQNRRYHGTLKLGNFTTDLDGTTTTAGFTWDNSNHTLQLHPNVLIDDIQLPSENTTINVLGDAVVDSIGTLAFDKSLTITGLSNPSYSPKLTVLGSISCDTNTNDLKLKDIEITANYISWNHNFGNITTNGLVLDNSQITIKGSGSGISAGQITLNDFTSKITLVDGYICTNYEDNLSNVPSYCPASGYTIGMDPDEGPGSSSPTRYLLVPGGTAKATNITLQKRTASTPSPSGSTYYRITVSEPVNGVVDTSHTYATRGTTVTITIKAAEGYGLETLTALDGNNNEIQFTDIGDGKYTFKMPANNVTVSTYFTLLPKFNDVDPEDYFYTPVRWALNEGITNGMDANHFGPDFACTRAQIVTFLWRTSGQPLVDRTTTNFTDVSPDSFYHDAVLWAVDTGVTKGTSDTTFSPDLICTREQAATFLYRYAKLNGIDTSVGEDTNILSYSDFDQISDFAFPALQWAVGANVVQGADGKIMPLADCTRAQIVTMLYRTMHQQP